MHSDEALVAAYLQGDEEMFAELAKRHIKAVYAYALRISGQQQDAEDIVQESFLKVWKNLKRFDARKARFKTWLMHIVRNTTIDRLRRIEEIPLSSFEDDDGDNALESGMTDDTPLPDEIAARESDKKELEEALERLSSAEREILLFYHQNDFSFEEMSHITGLPRNTLKSRYRRALAALRDLLVMHPNGKRDRI